MSLDLYKEIICSEAVNLSKEDKYSILKIVRVQHADKMKESPSGVKIRLDLLPEPIIMAIYNFMKNSLRLEDIN